MQQISGERLQDHWSSGFYVYLYQSKKDLEYADVRTATNFSEEALQTALSNVKQVNN